MKNRHKSTSSRNPGEVPGHDYLAMLTGLTHYGNLWEPVNDTVMGGRSHSNAGFNSSGQLCFHGQVSLENNGGFASVRTRRRLNLDGFAGFRLRLAGDGKRYSFRIKTKKDGQLHRFSYEAVFDTRDALHSDHSGCWKNPGTTGLSDRSLSLADDSHEEIWLPFDRFRPVFRGRQVPDAPDLDPSDSGEVSLMIKDGQEGSFELQVSDIAAYRLPQENEQQWMELALAMAGESGTPYGAVIVGPDDRIISKAGNRVGAASDASAHAEIEAIRKAGKKQGSAGLSGCRLFTTVEPCPMCMSAVIWAGISEVYYGAGIPDVVAAGGKQIMMRAAELAGRTPDSPVLYEGLCRDACIRKL